MTMKSLKTRNSGGVGAAYAPPTPPISRFDGRKFSHAIALVARQIVRFAGI